MAWKEAHRELKISPEEFDEVAAELGRTLDFVKVPRRRRRARSWPPSQHRGGSSGTAPAGGCVEALNTRQLPPRVAPAPGDRLVGPTRLSGRRRRGDRGGPAGQEGGDTRRGGGGAGRGPRRRNRGPRGGRVHHRGRPVPRGSTRGRGPREGAGPGHRRPTPRGSEPSRTRGGGEAEYRSGTDGAGADPAQGAAERVREEGSAAGGGHGRRQGHGTRPGGGGDRAGGACRFGPRLRTIGARRPATPKAPAGQSTAGYWSARQHRPPVGAVHGGPAGYALRAWAANCRSTHRPTGTQKARPAATTTRGPGSPSPLVAGPSPNPRPTARRPCGAIRTGSRHACRRARTTTT